MSGLTLLALLNVLNISRLGITRRVRRPERPLQAPVEREVRVVLAIPVAAAVDAVQHARRGRDRLRRPSLDAHVHQQLLRQLGVGEEVDLVADVAVRRPVVEAQIVEVERAIGERIALVRVVVFVLRQHVVRFELVVLREALAHAERDAAIQAVPAAVGDEHVAELRLERVRAGVGRRVARRRLVGGRARCRARCSSGSASGATPFATVKSTYAAIARRQLTLEAGVEAVDARVLVVAVEDANTGEERERARRHRRSAAAGSARPACRRSAELESRKSLFCWMPLVVTDPTWLSMFWRA